MGTTRVRFEWWSGLRRPIFRNLRLRGSWDAAGRYADRWSERPMAPFAAEDGCPAFAAEVEFDDAQAGWGFHWGVIADGPQAVNVWAIPTELSDAGSTAQYRSFTLGREGGQDNGKDGGKDGGIERYRLTECRRLGANKVFAQGVREPAIRFSVAAPHARNVELVIGDPATGYIASDGTGVEEVFAMAREPDGIWDSVSVPELARFSDLDHRPYMFRVERDDGSVAYRTDLYARCQIGGGRRNPEPASPPAHPESRWDGTRRDLLGTKSCSVVIDPERVTEHLTEDVWPERHWLDEAQFWADEYDPLRPVPDRLEDLVIYELHVEGLAAGSGRPGTFADAIALLDHLVELGVNAVELLPTAEAEGWTWGYGTSHHFATEYAGGGRDQFKHFVRACHRHGIAVLLDVVYNHFVADAERAQWFYDTVRHDRNHYYWYEGRESDWPAPDGGYLDNGSTGFTPNFRAEPVRKLFTGSAAVWLAEFHVDGFRVDLTQAMHRDNVRHADGRPCPEANAFGAKLLREWVRTLRLIKPSVMLTAEDHTGWRAITQPQSSGGIGFDAAWWAEWYHNLVGDSQADGGNARLVHVAGLGGDEPLAMARFADVLRATPLKVIYHESHDQAGNASYRVEGRDVFSARTIRVAVNDRLDGNRPWAEARCRAAAGLTLLTPGVPMFFMGEEVGAQEPYRYDDWLDHREDLHALRQGEGARLFRFYRDLIGLRRSQATLRSGDLAVLHAHDANRVIAFRRRLGEDHALVVASLNNRAFPDGYWLGSDAIPDGGWRESLNSDADTYGGSGLANADTLWSGGGRLNLRIPANAVIVLQRL